MDNIKQTSHFLFYASNDGKIKVQVIIDEKNETVWTTQKGMAELFNVESNTITYHLGEIFKSGELQEVTVTRKIRATANDGKSYLTNFYNLDVIINIARASAAKFILCSLVRVFKFNE